MLIVNSLVTSTARRVSMPLTAEQPQLVADVGRLARAQSRRDLVEQRPQDGGESSSQASPALDRVGVLSENLAICSRRAGRPRQLEVAAVGVRGEVGALRVDGVAVPLELEVATSRGGSSSTT
jgi:hypothetical protein